MHPFPDLPVPWETHVPDQQQQQHYFEQQYQQEQHQQGWPGQQHTQTPSIHGSTTNFTPTWPVTNTLASSPPASLEWSTGIHPTGTYNIDWYLSQVLHHNPLASTEGHGRQHVASLPDLKRAPPTEMQSTSSAHSDFGVTRGYVKYERSQVSELANAANSSGSKLGSAYSRRHGRPQSSSRSDTAGIVSKRRSHRSGGRHDRRIRRPNDRSWTVRDQDCLDTVLLMDELTKHQRTALVVRSFPNRVPLDYLLTCADAKTWPSPKKPRRVRIPVSRALKEITRDERRSAATFSRR